MTETKNQLHDPASDAHLIVAAIAAILVSVFSVFGFALSR
jgi:hypothetical protein